MVRLLLLRSFRLLPFKELSRAMNDEGACSMPTLFVMEVVR
jgi:hypothetical protein